MRPQDRGRGYIAHISCAMKNIRTLIVLSLLPPFLSSADAQDHHQLLFDTLADAPPSELVYGAVPTVNGDMVLSSKNGGALRLMRFNGAGEGQWDHVYPEVPANAWFGTPYTSELFERPDGHLLHAGFELHDCGCTYIDDPDTTAFTFGLMSLGSDGSLDWYKRITTSFIALGLWPTGILSTDVRVDAEGDLYFALHDNDRGQVVVLKADANGNLVWSKYLDSMASFFNSNNARPIQVVPDEQGGCYIVIGGEVSSGAARVVRFTMDGDVAWAKTIAYLNTVYYYGTGSARLAPNGDLLVGAELYVPPNSQLGYLLRIQPDGLAFQGDVYQNSGVLELAYGESSDVVVRSGKNYMRLDEQGTVLDAVQLNSVSNSGADHAFMPLSVHWDGTYLREAGTMHSTDLQFGFITMRPGHYTFGFDPATGCTLTEAQVEHLEVPPAYLGASDLEFGFIEHEVTTTPVATTVIAHAGWTSSDACALVTAVQGSDRPNALTVANNPSRDGTPMMMSAPVAFNVHLYDSRGACCAANVRGQAGEQVLLPVHELPAGLYTLVAMDLKGAPLGRCKVMVE